MAAYNGKAKRFKNALVALLSTIMYDTGSGDEPAFNHVYDSTSNAFDDYPSIQVLPGDLQTVKGAVGQQDRILAYIVRVWLPLEDEDRTESQTYDYMYDLTDLIIDALDEGDFHANIVSIDPTINTYILNATRGDWNVTENKGGVMLLCDVNIEARYTKNL